MPNKSSKQDTGGIMIFIIAAIPSIATMIYIYIKYHRIVKWDIILFGIFGYGFSLMLLYPIYYYIWGV